MLNSGYCLTVVQPPPECICDPPETQLLYRLSVVRLDGMAGTVPLTKVLDASKLWNDELEKVGMVP